MKKTLIILFGLLLLVGCSNNNDAEQPKVDKEDQNQAEQNQDQAENPDASEDEEANTEDATTDDATETDKNDHLKEFNEFDVLAAELDLNTYEGVVETDNNGNRIILFQDATGKKEFKSIFIKNDNRLKIVQFDNEDNLLFNDIIK